MMNSVLDFSPCSTTISPRLKRRLTTASATASAWFAVRSANSGTRRMSSRLDSIDISIDPFWRGAHRWVLTIGAIAKRGVDTRNHGPKCTRAVLFITQVYHDLQHDATRQRPDPRLGSCRLHRGGLRRASQLEPALDHRHRAGRP